jgi:TonB family protein
MHGELKEARKALDTSLRLKPDYADAHAALAFLLMVSEKTREAEAEGNRALELDDKLIDAHYVLGQLRLREGAWLKAIEEAGAIIKVNDKAAAAYWLKSQALLGLYERGNTILSDERRGVYDFNNQTVEEVRAAQPLRLKEAADNLEKYLQLNPKAPDAAALREQMETLLFYAHAAAETDPARKLYSSSSDNLARSVITYKPEPGFTEEARRANISGVVRLRAVLSFNGQVEHILVLKRLSHGLTERAVEAARRIKFKPATINGLPVSQYIVLEYNFNIY